MYQCVSLSSKGDVKHRKSACMCSSHAMRRWCFPGCVPSRSPFRDSGALLLRLYGFTLHNPYNNQFGRQVAAILEHMEAHTHTHTILAPSDTWRERFQSKQETTFLSRTEVWAQAAVYLEPDLYTRNHFSVSRTELRAQAVVYREEPRRSSGLRSHAAPFPPMLLSQSPGVCRAVTLLGPRIALTSPARATPFHAIPSKTQVEDDAREFTRVSQPQSAGAP